MSEKSNEVETFTFSGGNLCLDFANTMDDRMTAPQEKLPTYEALLDWSQQAQILSEEAIEELGQLAEAQSTEARGTLEHIKQVRETIYRIFSALADELSVSDEDLQAFNLVLAETMAHSCLKPDGMGFIWDWKSDHNPLERPLWFIVRSAADLLTSPERAWVRTCASDDCEWLFLDISKNHTRRWCDMKSCGNRAKARRHQARTRPVQRVQ